MAYAIVVAAGAQHRVQVGDRLRLWMHAGKLGEEVTFSQVLLVAQGSNIKVGKPFVAGVEVKGTVAHVGRGPKIRVFKKRRRKGFHKTIGHRQDVSEITITSIGG